MPPLQLLGHSWHISSDDLVLPAWVGVAFHGTWTALIAAELAIVGLPDDCPARELASSCVIWLLVSFGLTTLMQCVVAGISMRGAMLEEHKRAAMPGAMCGLLLAYCLEAAALIYATVVNFAFLRDGFNTCHTAEELSRTRISDLTLHRWFIGTTWGMLAVILGLLALLYNLYPDRGLESWEKRVNCLSYVMCCRQALGADAGDGSAPESSASTVVRLARVFGDLFYPLNFSFTDTVAAITLVGITHRSSAHGHGSSSHNHALIAAAGAGVLGADKHDAAPGAVALLEAAAALADAQAAAGPATGATGVLAQQVGINTGHAALAAEVAANQQIAVAAAGTSYNPVYLQQQQGAAASGANAAAASTTDALHGQVDAAAAAGATQAGGQRRSPSPCAQNMQDSKSSSSGGGGATRQGQGPVRSSSPALQEGPAVPFGRSVSASGSAWELAVRQGSTLALAPGHRLASFGAAAAATAGQGMGGSLGDRAGSTAGLALPARTQSTSEPSAAAAAASTTQAPVLRGQRSVSWAGAGFGEHPSLGCSSEQGPAGKHAAADAAVPAGVLGSSKAPPGTTLDCLTEGLAEGMELSLAGSHVLGQVQSLLSPLQSSDIAAADAGVPHAAAPALAGTAATGDTVGPAAAVAHGSGGSSASIAAAALPQQQQQALAAGAHNQLVLSTGAAGGMQAAQLQKAAAVAAAAAAEGALEVAGAVMSDGQLVPLELLEEALHWHAYANAIYGWPMFLWSHRYRVLRCCRLCCGGCCPGVRDAQRSSAGGVGGYAAVESGHPQAVQRSSKAAGRGSDHGGKGFSSPNAPPVLMLSAAESDSESPASTIAGAADGQLRGRRGQAAGPVAEAVEGAEGVLLGTSDSHPQQQQQQQVRVQQAGSGGPLAALVGALNVEQGGGTSSMQQQKQQPQSAPVAAAPVGSNRPSNSGAHSTAQHGSQSRWMQSGGNVWLLQGLADALGLSRDPASSPGAAAVLSPASSATSAAAAGSKGPLASAAGGLRDDGGLCGCVCGGKWGESHVPKMAPLTASQRLTNEAIMQTANIPAADLLYVNYNNLVEGLLPYSVALDAAKRCVVVAIRGSLSVEDCVTDILYDPAPLDADWLLQPATVEVLPDNDLTQTTQQQLQQQQATCQPEATAAAAAEAAAQQAAQDVLQELQYQQQQPLLGAFLDGSAAAAAPAAGAAAVGGEPSFVPGGPIPGASSGSFKSIRASPFATAAAAASAAARRSSTGVFGEDSGAAAGTQQPQQQQQLSPSPPQQQQPEASLACMPSVPAAQAAAAAAAAASRVPLPPAAAPGRALHQQWSINMASYQQPGVNRLSEQRSFLRRGGASQRQQQQQLGTPPAPEQQQQLTSRPSVLEGALSVLMGPWRRRTGSDAGGGQQQTPAASDAALAAAEEGRHTARPAYGPFGSAAAAAAAAAGAGAGTRAGAGAGAHRFGRPRVGSTEGVGEPGSGSTTPRNKLFKTMSLNLATAFGGGGHRTGGAAAGQAAGPGRRRLAATDSYRRLESGRQQSSLQSYASEMFPSGSTTRRSSADVWSQNQTRRTTAADRALGAARAGHRFAPLTSPATDQSAAAAAAHQRSFLQQQQQQQIRQSPLSSVHSMRSTAPVSVEGVEGSMSAASVAAAGPYAGAGAAGPYAAAAEALCGSLAGAAGERAQQAGSSQGRASSASSAAAGAAGGSGASSPLQGSPLAGRSRRTTFSQLPRIDSATTAAQFSSRPEQPGRQLSSAASVPAHLLNQQQQQQLQLLQADAGQARHSEEGLSSAGTSSSPSRRSLRPTASGLRQWHRRFGDQLSSQQQQQLADGGPTDWSLLHNAAPMVPSRTAAVKPASALPPAAAGGALLSMSYSARPASFVSAGARLATSFSLALRPQGPPSLAGGSTDDTAPCGSNATASEATSAAATAAAAAAAASTGNNTPVTPAAQDVSPFMMQVPGEQLGITTAAAADARQPPGSPHQWQQQQQAPWALQPLVDAGAADNAESAFAAALAAEEAALAAQAEEEAEEAAAAADAAAAAAQAAAAEETPDTGAAGAQWFAHEGILNCARAIRDDLDRLGLLDRLLLGASSAGAAAFAASAATPTQQQQEEEEEEGKGGVCRADASSCAGKCDAADAAGVTPGGAGAAAGVSGPEGRFFSSSEELPDCRSWTLVVTGHSLGAGVAALLALHYRARYKSVRAWCFAPPGGLMSPAAAASLKDICYSLVSAKDMIPRMSLWTIERLRDEMMICALRCKVPKYKLLLGAAFGKVWQEHEVLKPLEELSEAEVACFQDYRRSVVEERSLDPLRVRIAREFVPPGEVLWLERCKELQPRVRKACTSNNALASAAPPAAAPKALADSSSAGAVTTGDATTHPAQSAAPVDGQGAAPVAAAAAPTSAFAAVAAAAADFEEQGPGTTTKDPAAAATAAGAAHAQPSGSALSRSLGKSAMFRSGSAALGAAAVAVAGKRLVSRLQPHCTDGLGIIVGGMVVSRNMFADHVPDKQLAQLKRLVRSLRRQQALGQPLPAGIAPMVVAQAPLQQQGMSRRRAGQ